MPREIVLDDLAAGDQRAGTLEDGGDGERAAHA